MYMSGLRRRSWNRIRDPYKRHCEPFFQEKSHWVDELMRLVNKTDLHSRTPWRIGKRNVQLSRRWTALWWNLTSPPTTRLLGGRTDLPFYLQFKANEALKVFVCLWEIDYLPAWSAFRQQTIVARIQGGLLSGIKKSYGARVLSKFTLREAM